MRLAIATPDRPPSGSRWRTARPRARPPPTPSATPSRCGGGVRPASRRPPEIALDGGPLPAYVTPAWRGWSSPATAGRCRLPCPLLFRGGVLAPLADRRHRVRGAAAVHGRASLPTPSRVERLLFRGARRGRRLGYPFASAERCGWIR